jgi:alpha,alpha-trehalase
VLSRALDVLELLPHAQCRRLQERMGLTAEEIERWHDVARKLRIPFHDDGIISQFEGYGALKELDWAAYRAKYGDIQRLDRILEAEGDSANAYQASKQADVLMLFYLFSADELRGLFEQLGYPFGADTIPRNVEYYAARTSHGSTLSRIVHSWVVARSDRPRSWHLFQRALDSDIADIQGGTTREGIHVGAMAGTVDLVQRCWLGVEMRANVLHLDPALPGPLGCVRARLRYRRQVLDIMADHDVLRVESRPFTADRITVAYRHHVRDVAPGERYEFRLLRPEDRNRDENRAAAE